MRAEFFRPDAPDEIVGGAEWDGTAARVTAEDQDIREAMGRIFRVSPVATNDAATRPRGAGGDTVVEPGDLQWFLTAARVRAEREGLEVRFASVTPGGWDPAGSYLPMGVWVSRRELAGQTTETLGTPSQ